MERFIKTPFASIGDRDAIPDPIQSTGDVSMTTGYGYDYERDQTSDANAKNIERQKMNWLFYVITQALNEYQSLGVPDFITPELNGGVPYKYKKSAIVRYGGIIYISLVGDNTALPTDDTKWSALVLNNSDIFNGYLKTDNLLSEIKDKGTTSQQQARKNIGIDGDIAFRDKDNTFSESNTFNKSVTLKGGIGLWGHAGLYTSGGVGSGSIDLYRGADNGSTLQLSTVTVTGSKNIHYRFVMSHKDGMVVNVANVDYAVWNALNLKPVRTVNYVGPDASGNVNVAASTTPVIPVVGGVGETALVQINSTVSYPHGSTISGSELAYASIQADPSGFDPDIKTEGVLSGVWRVTGSLQTAAIGYAIKVSTAIRIA
ncbi:MAG: hypothetical protein RR068_01020 [Hafnia sp.]